MSLSQSALKNFFDSARWNFSAEYYVFESPAHGSSSSIEIDDNSKFRLYSLPDVRACGTPSILITPDNRVLGESIIYPVLDFDFESINLEDAPRRAGEYLFLDGVYSQYFWH